MSEREEVLREYQALREELLSWMERRNRRLDITWAGLAALVGVAFVTGTAELAAVALLLVASGWRDDARFLRNIISIGSYIRSYIESDLAGIRWETTLAKIHGDFTPCFTRRLKIAALSSYGIFGVVCTITFLVIFSTSAPSVARGSAQVLIFGTGFWFYLTAFKGAIEVPLERNRWSDTFDRSRTVHQ